MSFGFGCVCWRGKGIGEKYIMFIYFSIMIFIFKQKVIFLINLLNIAYTDIGLSNKCDFLFLTPFS